MLSNQESATLAEASRILEKVMREESERISLGGSQTQVEKYLRTTIGANPNESFYALWLDNQATRSGRLVSGSSLLGGSWRWQAGHQRWGALR